MIKVIITDDHPVVRQGIKQILSDYPEIEIVDEANNGEELLQKLKKVECDILLLDISMPGKNGLEILSQIKSDYKNIMVLVLSVHPMEQYALRAMKCGASGYLSKAGLPEELITAVKQLSQGHKYISSSLAEKIAFEVSVGNIDPSYNKLSDREFEVFRLIASGKKMTEIGEQLSLSVKTISTYRERILNKLNMKSNAELVKYALKEKIIE